MRLRRAGQAVLIVAVVISVSGCGVAANDVAATVGSTTISASLVNELTASTAFMEAMASQAVTENREGVVSGDSARQVLAFLIQKEVLSKEVERWGAEVTKADRQAAAKMIEEQAPQLKGSHRDLVAEFLADRDALQARLVAVDAKDESVLRRLYDGVTSYWDRVCMDAVVVRTNDIDRAERELGRGTRLADLAERVDGAQVVVTRDRCLPASTLPVNLRERLSGARVGALVGPVSGVFPGQDVVLWFRLSSTSHLSFSDARDELADLAASVVQRGVDQWLTLRANELVTVDPRYGTSILIGQQGLQVVAPPVPLGSAAAAATAGAADGAGAP